jgi:hypothetical protein
MTQRGLIRRAREWFPTLEIRSLLFGVARTRSYSMHRQLLWWLLTSRHWATTLLSGSNEWEKQMVVVTAATAHLAGAKFPERVAG